MLALLALSFLVGTAVPAHAGQWVVDHYVVSGTFRTDYFRYNHNTGNYNQGSYSEQVVPQVRLGNRLVTAPQGYSLGKEPDGVHARTVRCRYDGRRRVPARRAGAGQAGRTLADATVHAVFKWQARSLGYRFDGTSIPDPADVPSDTLWMVETSEVQFLSVIAVGGDNNYNYDYAHAYDGSLMHYVKLSDGLHDPETAQGPLPLANGTADAPWYPDQAWASGGSMLIRIATGGQTTVEGPDCRLLGDVRSSAYHDEPYMDGYSGNLSLNYSCTPAAFTLTARRMTSDNPQSFGSSVTLAAGAVNSPEHQAEVMLHFDPATVPGSSLPLKAIIDPHSPYNTTKAAFQANPNLTLDANCNVTLGTYTSSDTTVPVTLSVQQASANGTNAVTFNQVWDDGNKWTFATAWPVGAPSIAVSFQPCFTAANFSAMQCSHHFAFSHFQSDERDDTILRLLGANQTHGNH